MKLIGYGVGDRVAHANMDMLDKLIKKDLVIGLSKIKFDKDKSMMHIN